MSNKRILVADDETNMTRVLKLQLERAGYEVTTATDGRQALESILEAPPDVLVTDIHMPRMSGEELCVEIDKRMPARSFPIFIMTSMTDREHRRWTQGMRSTEFLEKPFSARVLIARIDKLMSERGESHGVHDG